MTNPEDKCPLCGEQMLSLACPGGCFTATAHEVDGLACKLHQLTKAKDELDRAPHGKRAVGGGMQVGILMVDGKAVENG